MSAPDKAYAAFERDIPANKQEDIMTEMEEWQRRVARKTPDLPT